MAAAATKPIFYAAARHVSGAAACAHKKQKADDLQPRPPASPSRNGGQSRTALHRRSPLSASDAGWSAAEHTQPRTQRASTCRASRQQRWVVCVGVGVGGGGGGGVCVCVGWGGGGGVSTEAGGWCWPGRRASCQTEAPGTSQHELDDLPGCASHASRSALPSCAGWKPPSAPTTHASRLTTHDSATQRTHDGHPRILT